MKVSMRLKGDFSKLRRFPEQIDKINDNVVFRLAGEAADDMKYNLDRNKTNTTSILTGSIELPKKNGQAHYIVGPTSKHGFFVEFGRSPGKFPSKDGQNIKDWMRSKSGISLNGKSEDQVAYLIGRKIAREGTKPQPFVAPVARDSKWRKRYYHLIKAEIDRFLS